MIMIKITAKRILLWLFCLILAAAIVALIVAYSGIYNIAASRGHPPWLEWFLTVGMENSIERNSSGIKVPDYDAAEMSPLAAAHFHTGCAVCHGAPGKLISPVFDHMLPVPPPLREHANEWKPHQLFWIVKHGLQYTGMPGWSGSQRDDEVWIVAGFVNVLPKLDEEEYTRLAYGNAKAEIKDLNSISDDSSALENLLNSCDRCHGTDNAPGTSSYVPRLGGQKRDYLLRSLREYKNNLRQSGIMEPLMADLEEEDFLELTRHYSELPEPARTTIHLDEDLVEKGEHIARHGDRNKHIPPCTHCHTHSSSSEFPKLHGQHVEYLENQLLLWKKGGRRATAWGDLMGFVTRNMSLEQIRAVSAYYASLPAFSADAPNENKHTPNEVQKR